MKKIVILSILLTAAINTTLIAQFGPELTGLDGKIQTQREADDKSFSFSEPIFTLNAVTKLKDSEIGINTSDSVGFNFGPGKNLRIYIACTGDPGNQAVARLYQISGSTGKVIKEIKCSSTEKKVLFFDFLTTGSEQLGLLLRLEKDTKAAAMARCIQFGREGK